MEDAAVAVAEVDAPKPLHVEVRQHHEEEAVVFSFGIEKDFEYSGHITQASQLVPLPRRVFASCDESHIRLWNYSGDIVKRKFPSNRRSMVRGMTYAPAYGVLLTAEIDMTIKAYVAQTLELMDTFYLEQLRQGSKDGSFKVVALAFLPQTNRALLGGDGGLEVWSLTKYTQRSADKTNLKFEFDRHVSNADVLDFLVDVVEARVVAWGRRHFAIYDMDMNPIANYPLKQTAEPIRCACLRVASLLETLLLTGGEHGNINFWNIQSRAAVDSADSRAVKVPELPPPGAEKPRRRHSRRSCHGVVDRSLHTMVELEHTFPGHSRPVVSVSFYHKGETRRLCVSCGRDGKMRVWSLVHFGLVYTLDLGLLDAKASLFPLGPHSFGISALQEAGGGGGQSTLSLLKFTTHICAPFATTNQSAVVHISRAPPPPDGLTAAAAEANPGFSFATVLTSEDMAVRLVDGDRVISTLPPPPNSKVQVLDVFFCPIWQLLILWLSSQEIAIFFVPTKPKTLDEELPGKRTSSSMGTLTSHAASTLHAASTTLGKAAASPEEPKPADQKRTTHATTPLLLRRFSVLEVCTQSADKQLRKESFRSAALYHGQPPRQGDTLLQFKFSDDDSKGGDDASRNPRTTRPDWFLLVGTVLGTAHAFRLRNILRECPIWHRLSEHLLEGAWTPMAPPLGSAMGTRVEVSIAALEEASQVERARAATLEFDSNVDALRVSGQRPFPRGAPPLRVFGRWRFHQYAVEVMETAPGRFLSMDAKRQLRIHEVVGLLCVFQCVLGEHSCHALYLQPQPLPETIEEDMMEEIHGHRPLGLAGLALGAPTGHLQLHITCDQEKYDGQLTTAAIADDQPEVVGVQSRGSHADTMLQIAFTWPANVFVTIGRDDTVKLWSKSLVLLKDIAFPQPLTSVAFRQGHEDVLLGFAAHVEAISYDFWSRGIAPGLIGEGSANVLSKQASMVEDARKSRTSRQSEDGRDDEVNLRLGHPDEVMSQGGNVFFSEAAEVGGEDVPVRKVDLAAERRAFAAKERLMQGRVEDFRGPPQVPLGTLSCPSGVANFEGIELLQKPAPSSVEHQRSQALGEGSYMAITRCAEEYYDWEVVPSTAADAPRSVAIRGTCGEDGKVRVTSLGLGYLMGGPQSASAAKRAKAKSPPPRRARSGCRASQASPDTGATSEAVALPLAPLASQQPLSSRPQRRLRLQPTVGDIALELRGGDGSAGEAIGEALANGGEKSSPKSPVAKPPHSADKTEEEIRRRGCRASNSAAEPAGDAAGMAAEEAAGEGEDALTAVASAVRRGSCRGSFGDDAFDLAYGDHASVEEEAWRNQPIGRGVPKSSNVAEAAPRSQTTANTEEDTAQLLEARGHIALVPDGSDDNFLKSVFIKKKRVHWLYCSPDDMVKYNPVSQHRQALKDSLGKVGLRASSWTNTGRLISPCDQPPRHAIPAWARPGPPAHMLPRPPMTRSEITQQRIIESASNPPQALMLDIGPLPRATPAPPPPPLSYSRQPQPPPGGFSDRIPSARSTLSARGDLSVSEGVSHALSSRDSAPWSAR